MDIHEYAEKHAEIQTNILRYIDSENDEDETEFKNIFDYLTNQNIQENKEEIKIFLHLIYKISNNHHRSPDFFNKIGKILLIYEKNYPKLFTNLELFNIFKNNKRILLFLIQNSIITIDQSISLIMTSSKYIKKRYPYYFSQELSALFTSNSMKGINSKIQEICDNDSSTFNRYRNLGENEKYICRLIQNDSIVEFIKYVSQVNIPLREQIEPSIFETHPFLISNNPTLIEYSAFFGSIEIFKYLVVNGVEINESVLPYAIHGRNIELFHYIEENYKQKESFYKICYYEAIKCHHNEIANYIIENFDVTNDVICCLKSYNFEFFPNEIDTKTFYCLGKYDYVSLVDKILQSPEIREKVGI